MSTPDPIPDPQPNPDPTPVDPSIPTAIPGFREPRPSYSNPINFDHQDKSPYIVGTELSDVLLGIGGGFLSGLGGNDLLVPGVLNYLGLNSPDAVDGGAGDDTLYLDQGFDSRSFEIFGPGEFSVYSLGGQLTAQSVEWISFANGKLQVRGYADRAVYGTDGADKLQTSFLKDFKLTGGLSNDTYEVSRADTIIVEKAGEGTDRVITTTDFALPQNVENIQAVGNAYVSLTGNDAKNYMGGNSGNNIFDGKGGADTMFGGAGSDTFLFRAGGAQGDVVGDFTKQDKLVFLGYGEDAFLTEVGTTDSYQIHSADNSIVETFKLAGVFGFNVADHPEQVLFA